MTHCYVTLHVYYEYIHTYLHVFNRHDIHHDGANVIISNILVIIMVVMTLVSVGPRGLYLVALCAFDGRILVE